MSPEQREKALLRYFASEEYIRDFHEKYELFWQNLKAAIRLFEENLPEGYETWPSKEKTEIWHSRVLSRHTTKDRFEKDVKKYLRGEPNTLSSLASDHSTLMSNIFNWMVLKWLDYIPESIRDTVFSPYDTNQASNIHYTLDDYWDSGEILDEEITGKIDDKVLKKYIN